jgi:transcriptional regulator with XRE-family HTH domain
MGSAEDLDLALTVIGERIKARRDELRKDKKDWSQKEIAESAEVDLKQFNKIENGKAEPRITTFIQIAGALGIPPAKLVEGLEWSPGKGRGFGHMNHEKP